MNIFFNNISNMRLFFNNYEQFIIYFFIFTVKVIRYV